MSNLIPEGNYRAVAVPIDTDDGRTYCQFGESSTGKTQTVVNFEILDGEHAGRRKAWFGYFTDATVQRTVTSLRYCGFKGNDLAGLVTQTLDQEVEIVIKHEEYKGETHDKIAWVNRGGGGGFKLEKQLDKNGLARFAAMMKGSVSQIPEVQGKKAERTAKPAASGATHGEQGDGPPPEWNDAAPPPRDDDIPF